MPRQPVPIVDIMENREAQPFEVPPPMLTQRPDIPDDVIRAESVSVRISIPGHVAASLLSAFPGTIEAAVARACETMLKLGVSVAQTRPIVLTDEHRCQAEEILAVSLFSPDELLRRIRRNSEIALADRQGEEIATVRLEPVIIERLHSRAVGPFRPWVEETVNDLIRRYVNM